MSTDPAMESYIPEASSNEGAAERNQNLPGMGGLYNSRNLQTYHYAGNNPLKYTDPTGLSSEPVDNDNEEELPTTGPGAMFKSAEEAAADFAKNYNGKSIEENKEYGSAIYEHTNEDGEKSYYYDEPDIGEGSTVGISYWTDENNPNGDKLAGFVHTHAAYDKEFDNNQFSGTQMGFKKKGDTDNADKHQLPSFLATPNGSLQKYDPITKKVTDITPKDGSIAFDPNDPTSPKKNKGA